MQFSHQQLTLWYGSADAPAPAGEVSAGDGPVRVTVAAKPASPTNVVTVRYCVDGGAERVIRAVRVQTDYAQGIEYHVATFPTLAPNRRVEYVAVLDCAGRTCPDPASIAAHRSHFVVSPDRAQGAANPTASATLPAASGERLPFGFDYLATITIPLKPPEIIGETPEGILVDWYWYPSEGLVSGPRLQAHVRRLGGDWMTIRRDGIGVMDVRATLETHDGALLYVNYPGYFDLGPDGYRNFLERRWPDKAPTRTTPRFHSAEGRYAWLNRVQCIGIGEVRMSESRYVYDLYALR